MHNILHVNIAYTSICQLFATGRPLGQPLRKTGTNFDDRVLSLRAEGTSRQCITPESIAAKPHLSPQRTANCAEVSAPASIHLLVILLVFAGNNGLPPVFMVQVPLDGLFDAVSKFRFRQPA